VRTKYWWIAWIAFIGCQPSDREVTPESAGDKNHPANSVTVTNQTTNELARTNPPSAPSR
jgi:hypothetical protein